MKTILKLMLLSVPLCAAMFAQAECSDVEYMAVQVQSNATEYVLFSADPDVIGYEVRVKIEIPSDNGPVTKREVRYATAEGMFAMASVIFNAAPEQITEVEIFCTRAGQN